MVVATKTVDRRTERTRRALKAAFVELLLVQGYEAVTPGEISRKANVGRSTFYLHYTGKEALLKESIKAPSSGLAACVDTSVTPQQLTPLFDHFREHSAVNQIVISFPVRPIWVKCLAALIEPRLPPVSRQAGVRPVIPRALIALTVAEMQIALITHWLTATPSVKSGSVAEALIISTRAVVVGIAGTRVAGNAK